MTRKCDNCNHEIKAVKREPKEDTTCRVCHIEYRRKDRSKHLESSRHVMCQEIIDYLKDADENQLKSLKKRVKS